MPAASKTMPRDEAAPAPPVRIVSASAEARKRAVAAAFDPDRHAADDLLKAFLPEREAASALAAGPPQPGSPKRALMGHVLHAGGSLLSAAISIGTLGGRLGGSGGSGQQEQAARDPAAAPAAAPASNDADDSGRPDTRAVLAAAKQAAAAAGKLAAATGTTPRTSTRNPGSSRKAAAAASSSPIHLQGRLFAPQRLEPPLAPAELNGRRLVVCVTGATGFVAGHIVHRLLAAGHTVRGTCRAPEDERAVAHLWLLPGAAERLSLHKADLLAPHGAFDIAIAGCDAVVHSASPYVVQGYRRGEEDARIVRPAVHGTESVLGSVERAAPTVRRVVLTASTASVFTDPVADVGRDLLGGGVGLGGDGGNGGNGGGNCGNGGGNGGNKAQKASSAKGGGGVTMATERDWNLGADKAALPYFFAKTAAERRAYELEKSQASPGRWTLASINPPAVLGPPLSSRADGESVGQMRDLLSGKLWPCGSPYVGVGACDVRDVAQAHALACVLPSAPRGRFLVASVSSGFALHEAAMLLRALYPQRWVPYEAVQIRALALPFCPMLGLPIAMARAMWAKPVALSTRRAREGLGKGGLGAAPSGLGQGAASLPAANALPYLPFEKTVTDMAAAMIERGMVPDERPVLVVFALKAVVVLALVLVAALLSLALAPGLAARVGAVF